MKNFISKFRKSILLFVMSAISCSSSVCARGIPTFTPGLQTVKNFLSTAIQPVGKTCYIWGGGWNDEDTGAGDSAKHIDVCQIWKQFFEKQNEKYNFRDYAVSKNGKKLIPIPKYLPLGLDCSGYRGWVLYNVFHTKSDEGDGYIFPHERRVSHFVESGWGASINPKDIKDYKAGDILDKSGHVYICIGQCSDKSVVLFHSSPPGVHICGTATPDGNKSSKAVALAKKYMTKYYPDWNKKFSHFGYVRGREYLTEYTQLRWNIGGAMKDPDNYTKMTPEEVLNDLFDEKQTLIASKFSKK